MIMTLKILRIKIPKRGINMKKIFVLAAVVIISVFAAQSASARGQAGQQAASQTETPPQNTAIKLPNGNVIYIPILEYLPSEDGWMTNLDDGFKSAKQENKKMIMLFAFVYRDKKGISKGYRASLDVEQPEFKKTIKDKYVLVYYTERTVPQEVRTLFNIPTDSQIDMIIFDNNGKILARERKIGPDYHYLLDFVNSVK